MAIRVKVVNEPPFIRVKGLSGGGGSDSVEVILNTKCTNDVPVALRLDSTSVYGWSVIRSAEDRTKIDGFCGHYMGDVNRSVERGFNQLLYRDYCKYEITAIYSDDGKTKITDIPLSYFRMHPLSDSNSTAVIGSTSPVTANIMAYKVKISFIGEVLEQDFFLNIVGEEPKEFPMTANAHAVKLRSNDIVSITKLQKYGITAQYNSGYGNKYYSIPSDQLDQFSLIIPVGIYDVSGNDITNDTSLYVDTQKVSNVPCLAVRPSKYRNPVYTVKVKFIKKQ